MFRMIPTDEKFYDLFTQAAGFFRAGAGILREIGADLGSLEANAARLEQVEADADKFAHSVLVKLDRSFITPIDREDIHRLTLALDDCTDTLDKAVEHMVLYGIREMPATVGTLAAIIEAQADQIVIAIPLLKTMEWSVVGPSCIEINRLENEADRVTRDATGALFEGNVDVMDVIRWRDIYGLLEDTTDRAEDVAGILEGIVLKHG